MKELFDHLKPPEMFSSSPQNIWNVDKLNDLIINSHLDDDTYGGSYSKNFRESIIKFIVEIAPSEDYKNLLDLGCGPGLYSNELCIQGYNVTGVDYSKNSIEYARNIATINNLSIDYIVKDILEYKPSKHFDIIIMVFEILNTFDSKQRKRLINNIYNSLNNGGLFIFDVPSRYRWNLIQEMSVWSSQERYNKYIDYEYLQLFSNIKYEDGLLLNRSNYIFSDESIYTFYDWIQHFTKKSIVEEVENSGFTVKGVYGDMAGNKLRDDSSTISLLCEK